MKIFIMTSILAFFATSAFAGDFVCTYKYQRNSTVLKKQITTSRELIPPATIRLDAPESANLRARLQREVWVDNHHLIISGLLNQQGQLNMNIVDDHAPHSASFAGVTHAVAGQKLHVQHNFSAHPGLITLVWETCSFTE